MPEASPQRVRLMTADLWVLVVLGIAGIVFFLAKFNQSFPAASIDLRLPKSQIVQRARQWSERVGYNPQGAIASTIFSIDDDAKTFLEYELGQAEANRLMRQEVPVWSWRSRFCRPFQQEECSVGIRPDGELAYFERSLPNDLSMPALDHEQAKVLAQKFFEEQAKTPVAENKLVDDSEEKQLNRVDHYFTWEDSARDFKGAHLRTYVYVSGNAVTQYSRYLHVPEQFQRKYHELRSWNELLKSISGIVYVVLSSAIGFVFIWGFASGAIRWKVAIAAGAVSAVLSILSWIDSYPSFVAGYPTTTAFNQYLTESLVGLAFSTLFSFISLMVFVGALEPIYRKLFPEKIAVESMATQKGLRTASTWRSLVAGLSVFGIHTAYVVAYYLIGQHLNFWSPLEVRETAVLSGSLPIYDAVSVGIVAGVTEEFMYRVLALWLFQKLTRNFWLANFLQAASWAFMHSDYPQEPAYTRGIELTIGGFFYGWVLRRFGLLACVLAHYTYDAFLGVTPLLVSHYPGDPPLAVVAILPGFIALAISSWLIARKNLLVDETELENQSIKPSRKPPPLKEIETPIEFHYKPLSQKLRLAIAAVACFMLIIAASLQLPTVGENNVLQISRAKAIDIAAEYLQKNGISTRDMQSAAWLTDQSDSTEMQYVFEKEKFERTKALAKKIEPRLLWRVRFFKERDSNEYYVSISPTGTPQGQYVVRDESTEGKKLAASDARQKVEAFLSAEHAALKPLVFEESTRHERAARVDYDLEFSVPELKAGEAKYKIYTGTVGGDVSGFSRGWQLPDKWIYERQKQSRKEQIFGIVRQITYGIFGLLCLWWAVDILRSHTIRWKPAIVLGVCAAGITLVSQLNAIPTFFAYYATEDAIRTFVMQRLVQTAISVISAVAATTLIAAFAYGAYIKLNPQMPLASLVRPILPTGLGGSGSNRSLWFDAVMVAYGMGGIIGAVDRIVDFFAYRVSPSVHLYPLRIQSIGDQWSPSLGAIASAISGAALAPIVLVIAISFFDKIKCRSFLRCVGVALLFGALSLSSARYWQDYVFQLISLLIIFSFCYFTVARVARQNLLAYVLFGYLATLSGPLHWMLKSGYELYFGHIAVLVLAMLAPLAYTIWLYLTARGKPAVIPAAAPKTD